MSFFQTTSENLSCCSTASTMQHESAKQNSVEKESFWNLKRSKFVNHNGINMVDVWNVNKLTTARTKMEVGKLRIRVAQR